MASGNHYGKGSVRQMELRASCAALGVWEEHCDVLDIPELQDDPKVFWPHEKIKEVVNEYVLRWSIDTVSSAQIIIVHESKGSRRLIR